MLIMLNVHMSYSALQQAFRPLKEWVLDLIFPKECLGGCGGWSHYLCIDCLWKIPLNSVQTCLTCGCRLAKNDICQRSECKKNFYLDNVLVVANYRDSKILKDAIHLFKYRFAQDLAHNLAILMLRKFWRFFTENHFIIVPVPLHSKRMLFRGFNQAELLSQQLASLSGKHYINLLERTKSTKAQAELSGKNRRKNLRHAFRSKGSVVGHNILLVDDVATTGSTLNECAKILKFCGANKVTALVLAQSPLLE